MMIEKILRMIEEIRRRAISAYYRYDFEELKKIEGRVRRCLEEIKSE